MEANMTSVAQLLRRKCGCHVLGKGVVKHRAESFMSVLQIVW